MNDWDETKSAIYIYPVYSGIKNIIAGAIFGGLTRETYEQIKGK